MLNVSENEFKQFSRLIHERSGINLGEQKRFMLAARLGRRVRLLGLKTFGEYFEILTQGDPDGTEMCNMIDAISTNLTEFYREPAHFEYLRKVFFPKWANGPVIRIFSAGCATGEEAYSIAICARQYFGDAAVSKVQVLACDISTSALRQAKLGTYSLSRLRLLPPDLVKTSFTIQGGESAEFSVSPLIKRMVTFQPLNLANPINADGVFHAIFCRNVVIYFDRHTQYKVFEQLHRALMPGGNLFIGHSESMIGFDFGFQYVQPTVYERTRQGALCD